jgi:hypothetical protein
MGDFNAKIGEENCNNDVPGKYTLHDTTSENRKKLIQFAQMHDLVVASTKFQHKRIHKGTWIIPGTMETNQIYHVLINKRRQSSDMYDQ